MSNLPHPPNDWLIAFGQGRLADAQAETIEAHLTECAECQRQVEAAPDDAVITLVRSALPVGSTKATAATRTEYRSLTPFARGGLGEVLIARDTAVGRDVAVKRLLREVGDHPERRKRFLREAAITGRLEHPGVAPVYGIGEDESGQPCYAMRFVPGRTLADAIRELHSSGPVTAATLRPLLARFIALCGTVAYAHSRGVIHRDIKPSNVAVGAFGETILLDWGLAQTDNEIREQEPGARSQKSEIKSQKPAGVQTSDSSLPTPEPQAFDRFQTLTGAILGTPGYMAPEQAAGKRVGPAADVYSLGVTLRTILTGCGLEVVGSRFPALTAIVRRATAADPASRYASALELAGDVERWLADEPVSAYPDPFAVRARRFIRRHQIAAAAVLVLLIAVTVSLSVGAVLLGQEQRKTAKALVAESEQRTKAEAKEAETASILTYVDKHVFAAGRPKGRDGGLGKDVKLAEAVTLAAASLESSFAGQPLTEARVRGMLGTTLLHLGDAKSAERQFAVACQLYGEHYGPDHADTLRNMNNLATSYRALGRPMEALALDEAVADRRKASLGLDHRDTLRSLHYLANSYAALGREEDALRLDSEVYSRRLATLGPDDPDTIMSMASLASSHGALRQHDEALKLREEVLKRRQAQFGPDHADTITAMNNLANTYGNLGRHDDALAMRVQVVELMRSNSGPDHADTLMAMNNLARSYGDLRRWPDALRLHREVLKLRQTNLGLDHPETLISMYNVATSILEMGQGDEAIIEFDEIVRRAEGKPVNIRLVPTILEKRLRYFAGRGNVAECRASAKTWEEKLRPNTAEFLAHAAQLWSMTSGVQARVPGVDAARMAREDADRAMAWLTRAVAAGFKDAAHIRENGDFDSLRDREDFQKLLAKLDTKKK